MSTAATFFKNNKSALKRHFAMLFALALCCALLFFWAGYTFLPKIKSTMQRQIVNDDYSTLTPLLGQKDTLSQQIYVKGRLYGVILNLSTLNRVASGTLHIKLLAQNGQVAASCNANMAPLLDNTFHSFLFDAPIDAAGGQTFVLQLSLSPQTPQDQLAFYCSAGPAANFAKDGQSEPAYPLENFALQHNEKPLKGTLALQYISRYAGGFATTFFVAFAVFLSLVLLFAYVLLFVLRPGAAGVFVVLCLLWGVFFAFFVPPPAKGEAVHIANAYHYTNILFGTAQRDGQGSIYVRQSDQEILNPPAPGIFAWQDMAQKAKTPAAKTQFVPLLASTDATPFVLYLPQILGMALARFFGLGSLQLLVFGRLFALLLYTGLAAFAIFKTPVAKPVFVAVSLLACSLQYAASFFAVGAVFGLGLLFAAFAICKLCEGKKNHLPKAVFWASGAFAMALCSVALLPHNVFEANGQKAHWLQAALFGGLLPQEAPLNWLFVLLFFGLFFCLGIPGGGAKILPAKARPATFFCLVGCAVAAVFFGGFLPPLLLFGLLFLHGQNLRFRRDIFGALLFFAQVAQVLILLDFLLYSCF